MGCAVEIQILEISADADFPLPAYGCRVYFGKELRDLAEALPHVSPALVAQMAGPRRSRRNRRNNFDRPLRGKGKRHRESSPEPDEERNHFRSKPSPLSLKARSLHYRRITAI